MIKKSIYELLTEKEKFYIQRIEYHANEIPGISIQDLAAKIYTSPASLSRLVKKLGYSSYKEFKLSFVTKPNNIPMNNTLFLHIEQLFDHYPHIIKSNIIPSITNTRQIFIVAFGPTAAIAHELGQSLNMLKIKYLIVHDSECIAQLQVLFEKDDLIIYISYSGADYQMEQLAVMYKHVSKQILLTSTIGSPLSAHVSFVINTNTHELCLPYITRLPLQAIITIINLNLLRQFPPINTK